MHLGLDSPLDVRVLQSDESKCTCVWNAQQVKLTTDHPGIRKALQCVYPVQVSSAMTLPCVERGKLNIKICSIFYFDKDFVVGSRERQTVSNSQVVEEIMYVLHSLKAQDFLKYPKSVSTSHINNSSNVSTAGESLHACRRTSRTSSNTWGHTFSH